MVAEDPNGWGTKTREVRLGLVMYGGVSLAIHINGVAAEFFRTVRGRGIYRLIKALTDSDIIVDVISGTSAGGINGVLLAYALCNNRDFLSSAMLWRRDGDIRSLLRRPDGDADSSRSLLNSEGYFQPRLEEAFRYMRDYVPEKGEMVSDFKELDLFVTGTDVDGNIYTQFDDAGHAIDIKDHRSVFLLKHRSKRKEPFNPKMNAAGMTAPNPDATYRALAKLSRITSCFPAAFTPVQVTTAGSDEDKILQTWGQLGKDSCFLDGGVIDNKPFTYTLKEIFDRSGDRQIDRKLFYVEPDPERFTKVESATTPNVYEAVIASLIGIPGYESIADDLKLLATHNSKLNQYKRLIHCLDSLPKSGLSPAQEQMYRQSRLIAISERVVRGVLRDGHKDKPLGPRDRKAAAALIGAFDRLFAPAGANSANAIEYAGRVLDNFDVYFRLRRLYRAVYLIAEKLYDKNDPVQGERRAKYTTIWREFNRQIKFLEILRVTMEDLIDRAPIDWKDAIEKKLESGEQATFDQELAKIWGLVSLSMRNFLDMDERLKKLLPAKYEKPPKGSDWLDHKMLSAMNEHLKNSVAPRIIKEIARSPLAPSLPEPDMKKSLLSLSDSYEQQILALFLEDEEDPLRRAYTGFADLDALLYPIEMIAGLREKDIIQTIRISPADAEKGFSNKNLADKVSGDALYHFGGFFKRSWRSNDILWGRLDSCCQLTESLLDLDRMKDLLESKTMRKKLRGYFSTNPEDGNAIHWIESMDPKKLFDASREPTHKALQQWIENLLSEDASRRADALDKDTFNNHVCWLIEAAQLEIIKEELPGVITDALEEQAQWNQFRVPKLEFEPKAAATYVRPFVFSPVEGSLDPFVSVIAAAGQARTVMAKLEDGPNATPERPTKTGLGQFFMNDYRVGTEALLKDMPVLILLEILSVSLLVLRNCVLGIFGERADKIKRNPLYLFGLDYPLRSFYAIVLFIRRAPSAWKASLVFFFFLSVIALTIGVTWRDSIIYDGENFYLKWFIIFIAAPLVILFSQGVFFLRRRVDQVGIGRLGRDILTALMFLSPLILLGVAYRQIAMGWEQLYSRFNREPQVLSDIKVLLSGKLLSAGLFILMAIVILPFLKLLFSRLSAARKERPRELREALEDFFDVESIKEIARRLIVPNRELQAPLEGVVDPTTFQEIVQCWDLPSKFREHLDKLTSRQRSQFRRDMAKTVVNWAMQQKKLTHLSNEMRTVNPEVLYYL